MYLVLIAIHKGGANLKDIVGFRILDSDSGEVSDITYNNVVNTLLNKNVTVDGIDVSTGIPKGSNGSFDRYTQLANNITIGKCPLVIVKEYPNKVYGVANHLGQMTKMNIDEIVRYSKLEGIANGKIVFTDSSTYLSSINGEYPKDSSFKDLERGKTVQAKMTILGVDDFEINADNFAVGLDKTIETLAIPKGVLGIVNNGFRDFTELKEVSLPTTCTTLGIGAFSNCKKLESIQFSEGVTVIPKKCFENCVSLRKIVLPNSIREIKNMAFKGCKSLEISLGAVKPSIELGAFTGSVRTTVRR